MFLKVKTADIPPEGMEILGELPVQEARDRLKSLEGEPISPAAPISVQLRLAPTGSKIVVRGLVQTLVRAVCGRCLEEFDLPIRENILVVYSSLAEELGREELEAEELNMELFTGEEIDLWPLIQEHLVLALPLRPLCREDCRGLCPVCGRNRNISPCECVRETVHPGLVGLKKLKEKLPQ